MCFGLGEGLGFWYLKKIPLSPSILIHVRTYPLEKNFFTNIKISFKWEQFSSSSEAISSLKKKILEGRPALIQTDIYYLPYFKSSTHFPGHAIVVWGVDEEKKEFYVSDTQHEELLSVPFKDMEKAIYYPRGFFKSRGNQFSPFSLSLPSCLEKSIKRAIFRTSYNMVYPQHRGEGLKAMALWIKEIDQWKYLEDWRWTARFTYQVIEKRGTGGGGFRFIYTEYLEEASNYIPLLKKEGLVQQMYELGKKWRDIAYRLREISEDSLRGFVHLKPFLLDIYQKEEYFHLRIIKLFGNLPSLKFHP